MNKLYETAQQVLGQNGEYMSVNDVIAKYPEGVTLTGTFTRAFNLDIDIPVFTFSEEEGRYFPAASGDLKALYQAWLTQCGSIEALNEQLKDERPRIKMEKVRTKKGNTYLKVIVLPPPQDNIIDFEAEIPF